jgi:CHAT domain-containing protein
LPLISQVPDTTLAHQVLEEAMELKENRSYRAALEKFQEATQLFITGLDSHHLRIVDLYQYQSGVFSVLRKSQDRYLINKKCFKILEVNDALYSEMAGNVHNSQGIAASNLSKYDEAEYHYKKAIQLSDSLSADNYYVAAIYGNLGILSRRIGNYDEALAYLSKSMSIYRKLDDLPKIATSHINIGNVYVGLYENEKALYHYQKAISNQDSIIKYYPNIAFSAYQGIAKYYKDMLEYDYALLNYQKAKTSLLDIFDEEHPYYLRNERMISEVYHKMGQHRQAIDVIQDDVQRQGEKLKNGFSLELLGQYYRAMDSMELAVSFINRSKELTKRLKGEDSKDYIYPLVQSAINHLVQKQYKQSEEIFLDVYTRLNAFLPADHPRIAKIEFFLAEIYSQTGRFSEALHYCDQALRKLGHHPDSIFAFEQSKKLRIWEEVHRQKAHVLYEKYLQFPTDSNAFSALTHHVLHLNYLRKIQSGLVENTSKLQLLNKYHKISERTIEILLDLHKLTKDRIYVAQAFEIADNSKDNLLEELTLRRQLKAAESLTMKNGNQESLLLAEIADLELEIFRLEQNNASEEETRSVKNKILVKRDQILKINKVANQDRYIATGEFSQGAKVLEWQKALPIHTAFFELFSGAENTYLFLFTHDGVWLVKQLNSSELNPIISEFRESLNDFENSNWVESGYALYNMILKDAISHLDGQINHIVFIQDGEISGIPFEALSKTQTGDLLIEDFTISYSPSFGILNLGKSSHSDNAKKTFAAFAPRYDNFDIAVEDTIGSPQFSMLVRSGNYHLPGAQEEVKEIQKLIKGKLFLGEEANESTFKKNSSLYQILHLSMHAIQEHKNPSFSRLIFSPVDHAEDGFLFTNELIALSLNANLAVLSACNTGSGQLRKGEGVLSLARAFNYAGVQSTIHSLWKVPDAATKQIMVSFYAQLKEGKSKAAALHQAKKDYLLNEMIPERKHPYYWAGFILNGNWEPIQFSKNIKIPWFYILGGIILISGIIIIFKNIMKENT